MKASTKKYFHQSLRRHYPTDFQKLQLNIENHYQAISPDTAFARTSPNPIDRRLDFAAYFLAVILALEKHGETFAQIRNVCLEIAYEYVRPKNRWQQWLKRLPVKLFSTPVRWLIIRFMKKKTGKLAHPDGFRAEILTDPAETYDFGYGFDITECGICKLFQKHGAHPYASILCEVDKVTSALAGLELVRSGTIASGAARCDFRFKKLG